MKNDSALFYTCSLIEFIGRKQKIRRSDLVNLLGKKTISRIYRYADVFHSEPINKTAEDFIDMCEIHQGDFDNVASCRYMVPDYWTIGDVYKRLIEDVCGEEKEQVVEKLMEVYNSWIDKALSNYNTDFYYQSREYIHECYKEGTVCP